MPKILLKENNQEIVNRRDDKNILIKLFTFIIIKIDNKDLFTDYNFIRDGIIYDKV